MTGDFCELLDEQRDLQLFRFAASCMFSHMDDVSWLYESNTIGFQDESKSRRSG